MKHSSPRIVCISLGLVFLFGLGHTLPAFEQKPLLYHGEQGSIELGPSKEHSKPWAVGFELGPAYGTASIRWANGNYTHVAKINGDTKYLDAMRFYSSEAAKHPHRPYQAFGEDLVDLPRRLLRQARKSIGLPATEEVGALGAMLKNLRDATQWYLDDEVHEAIVVRPALNALYEEDIFDALELADLPYLKLCHMSSDAAAADGMSDYDDCAVPNAHFAALAGEGVGMCANYTDDAVCREEGEKGEGANSLVVDWSREYLQITDRASKTPYELWGYYSEYRTDTIRYDLGYAKHPTRDGDDGDGEEWIGNVTEYVLDAVRRARHNGDVTHIVMTGDAVRGGRRSDDSGIFLSWFIYFALEDEGQQDDPKWFWDCDTDGEEEYKPCGDRDPAFTGANGAAEMAWRWERGLWREPEKDKESGKGGEECWDEEV